MSAILLTFALVALLLASFAPQASAESDRPHLSTDPQIVKARTLVNNGQFAQGLGILRPLRGNHPDQTDVLFLIGLAAVELSLVEENEASRAELLDEAIRAFHAILVERPALIRVRLELARALFLNGQDGLAEEHFERVLAGDPLPAIAYNVRKFLGAIRERKRWSGYFGFSLAPDTNINSASDSNVIYIFGLPFRRETNQSATSGVGVLLWGGGEYLHPLRDDLGIRIGGDFSVREYKTKRFDEYALGGHVGPRWAASKDLNLSLLGILRRTWVAGESYSRDYGLRLEAERRIKRNLSASVQAGWQMRRYWGNKEFDGPVMTTSARFVWLPTSVIRVDASLGREWERPGAFRWRNQEWWGQGGLSFALPYGFTLGSSVRRRWTSYRGNWQPFTLQGQPRKDKQSVLRASLHNRGFTLFGFSPEIAVVREKNEANAQLYSYKRTRAELRFVRQF